jgi:hypothetical protein
MRTPACLQRLRAPVLIRGLLPLCLCGALASGVQAAPPSAATGQVWHTVGDQRLASLRGGFNLGGGLEISFGMTRSVFINGNLVTETTLNLGRVSDITPRWADQLRQELQSIRVVQNGPGNIVINGSDLTGSSPQGAVPSAIAIAGTAPGTVIQNSLNNQQILHQTIINASSNALGLLRSSSLHNSLSEVIRQSVGQR